MPHNACELEIDLFCHGLRLPPGALLPGARGVTRTRAGLGSGLEIAIPAPLAKREIWVNVPIAEAFVQKDAIPTDRRPRGGIRDRGRARRLDLSDPPAG
jgi:hypothetical protein